MKSLSRTTWVFLSLSIFLFFFILLDLRLGSVNITFRQMLRHLGGVEQLGQGDLIILQAFRIPRIITALLAGAALPACGLMMQTLFRNPLAGPYVLGISSGASFGAALVVLGVGATGLVATWSLALAAWTGSAVVMLLLLYVSFRIRESLTILILGIMFSSGLAALISIMQYFSRASALKSFVIWSMGSLGNVSGSQLGLMAAVVIPMLIFTLGLSKIMNGWLLGEEYAHTMGIRIRLSRTLILASTSLLAGTITAFCGPIGFIGIAVPHMARFLFRTSDHRILLPATMLTGMVVLLISDLLSQLPGSERVLPINAVTSLIGIPVVIWLVVVHRKSAVQS